MNEIFNAKRFGKYFLYDLRNAKNNYWLSLLICAGIPIISFALVEIFAKLIDGNFIYAGLGTQIPALVTAYMIVILTFPVKAYGSVTDKRSGSAWLMLPASPFEKWLSVILITCVILPVIFFALLFVAEAVLHLVFPGGWPVPAAQALGSFNDMVLSENGGLLSFNFPALAIYSWMENILVFTLGAMIFKKAKVGKTFLAVWVIGMAFSMLTSVIFGVTAISSDTIGEMFLDPEANPMKFVNFFNYFILGVCLLYILACAAGLYYRIKTLKH